MSDGPDKPKFAMELRPEGRVESLANQAIALLASRRVAARSILSEKLMAELLDSVSGRSGVGPAAIIERMLAAGIRDADIQDLYIPDAARRLGAGWSDDTIGFAEVTIAVSRLQRMLLELPQYSDSVRDSQFAGLSTLLVVPENELHTLGARVVAAQLRKLGVTVRLSMSEPDSKAVAHVADRHFDAIFLSVGVSNKLANVRRLIEKLRQGAGPTSKICLGGSVTLIGVDLQARTGADIVTNDPKEALRRCVRTTLHQGASSRVSSE